MDLHQEIRLPKLDQVTALAGTTLIAAIAALYLLVKFSLALFTAHSVSAAEMQQRQMQLKAQDMAVAPMRNLPQKLETADEQAAKFYQDRFPAEYSTVLAELGGLEKETGVKMTRVTYAPKAAGGGVTEIRMEAALAGEYQGLMKFINGMERDKLFFVVRGVTLTGTQGGVVNLRLQMNTYLRPGTGADEALASAAAGADENNASGENANPKPEAR